MRRASFVVLALLSFAGNAGAATVRDARDGFAIDIDVPGLKTCILFTEDPARQRACDGLDPAALAELANAQRGAIAAALVIGPDWGFEIVIRRTPSDGFVFDEESATDFARQARNDVRGPNGAGLVGGGEAHADLVALDHTVVARAAFAVGVGTDAPPVRRVLERQIVYGIAGNTGVVHVVVACEEGHAATAESMVLAMLHKAQIAPGRPLVPAALRTAVTLKLGLGLLAAMFSVLMVARVRAKRRGVRGVAATGWPGLRGEDRE